MKNLYKAALMAALGFTAAYSAHAGTADLILGFDDPSVAAASQQDYFLDIGVSTAFTASSVQNGTFSGTSLGLVDTSSGGLADVYAGVIEDKSSSPKSVEFTSLSTPASGAINNFTQTASLIFSVSGTAGVGSGVVESSTTSTPNASFSSATSGTANGYSLANNGITANQNLVSGTITENFWNYSSTGSPTELGTFTINANNDTWAYNGINAVPEPASYGLMAGAGLLLTVLRRQFTSKNA